MDSRLRPCGGALMLKHCGVLGRVIAALAFGWTVLVLGWSAILADTAFPMVEGFPSLGWILLALAAVGAWKGPGACARCAGIVCLFLAALLGAIAGLSVPDVTVSDLRPQSTWQEGLWALGLFLLPAPVFFLPCKKGKKSTLRWLLLPVFAAVLAAITAGVLTPELTAQLETPLYTVAQSVSLLGAIERIEPLLSAAMTMGVFCLLTVLACACGALGRALGLGKWAGPAACAVACIAMYPARFLTLPLLTVGNIVFWTLPLVVKTFVHHNL